MVGVPAEYPFTGYNLYIVFHKGEGRYYANLKPIRGNGLKRKTISYARYLMSVKEGRILSQNEQVDHIDDDKTNDVIDNLQILTVRENNIKEANRKGRQMVVLLCPNCGHIFERRREQSPVIKSKQGTYAFCCKECAQKFHSKILKNPNDKLLNLAASYNVLEEYTKYNQIEY